MNSDTEKQVQDYIQEHESDSITGGLFELVNTITGKESSESEEKDKFHLSDWLKNDKSLLDYAELTMKTEKLNLGESFNQKLLELKLSITCPYFADFKIFLEELKKGGGLNQDDSIIMSSEDAEKNKYTFLGKNISDIKSHSYEATATGANRSSRVAYNNGRNFGIMLPTGSAFSAGKTVSKLKSITSKNNSAEKDATPNNKREKIGYDEFIENDAGNFVDLFIKSESSYGHRATAFKGDDGVRYVLDPFTTVNGKMGPSPKKLEDYMKVRDVVKANFYESTGYSFKEDYNPYAQGETGDTAGGDNSGGQLSEDSGNAEDSIEWTVSDSNERATNKQVEDAIQWAISIANDNSIGYEWGGKDRGGYDCSGLVTSAFKHAGFHVPVSGTATMQENFTKAGFEWISPYDPKKLQRGDILLKGHGPDGKRHTEIYLGNKQFVGARGNKDKRKGDSSGKEIAVTRSNDGTARHFLNEYPREGILRYKG